MMLEIMNRHDWCFLICLIGGGQEIHTGEAGLSEWGNVLKTNFKNWKIYISPELLHGHHSTANKKLFSSLPKKMKVVTNKNLHLKVSLRQPKSEKLSSFIGHILDLNLKNAKKDFQSMKKTYPIFITRDLEKAKLFIKNSKLRGTRRAGILASSGGKRLRAFGLNTDRKIDFKNWFLEDKNDVRSSSFLEIPATEFSVQGLELDWSIVCWDADLRIIGNQWGYYNFKGSKWQKVNNNTIKEFILNRYRVLLTRARDGMIIFVPNGSTEDITRNKDYYDKTFYFLKNTIGIKEL